MAARRLKTGIVAGAFVALGFVVWPVVRPPSPFLDPPLVVNDVSRLNPVTVGRLLEPTTTAEIADAVRAHAGPIAIGGARHSMGGQIATNGALFLDMRRFNRILEFVPAEKRITVQAGARWRDIQERIDPANLSVAIMQSYANFTVGGSLSVNAHGRYVGVGPVVDSVLGIEIVLADGTTLRASPAEHADVFHGAIGGYGGLGVITEVTLRLVDNVALRRSTIEMPVAAYPRHFATLRSRSDVVLHNADLYPPAWTHLRAITYSRTDRPVTVQARLRPVDESSAVHRFTYWFIAAAPFGRAVRRRVIDPIRYAGDEVVWRNYEASYDVNALEPSSRDRSTYALQEYFVPVERFASFVPRLAAVLQGHDVDALNVSVRHIVADPGTLLAWARTEVFGFVIYYRQGTTAAAREATGRWTRELVDASLAEGGSYYLPYQLHATPDQFRRAYPRHAEFFALKARLDPRNKFRNEFLNKYRFDP